MFIYLPVDTLTVHYKVQYCLEYKDHLLLLSIMLRVVFSTYVLCLYGIRILQPINQSNATVFGFKFILKIFCPV